jgi:hypothetical protein
MNNAKTKLISARVLESLRKEAESYRTELDGARWGMVYLDNIKTNEISPHQIAGGLSYLKECGLYRPCDGHFGEVRMKQTI